MLLKTVDHKARKCNKFLYFAAIAANLAAFNTGTIYAWSSPAIPRLNGQIDEENNPLSRNITPNEEAWIASLVPLGAAISAFISGYLSDRIGRKYTLLASSVPAIFGYISLWLGAEIVYYYIGRFLCGVGVGISFTIIPIYVGEIAESINRGILGCFITFFISSGNLYVYFLTPYVNLKTLSAVCLITPIIFVILFAIFAPESPYYYIKKNRTDLAEKSLLKLRSNDLEIVQEELPLIVKDVQGSFSKKLTLRDVLQDRTTLRGFGVSLGLMFFQQWSGVNAVFFYMQSIFEETNSGITSDTCVIIAGLVQIFGSVVTLPTIDRFGRRILLLISGVGNALTLLAVAIYFYLKEHTGIQLDHIDWLPVLAINLFILTYTLGFGPVSFTMIGELFSPHTKSFAATVNIVMCLTCVFAVSNVFSYLKESIGFGLSFGFFAIICCFSVAFVYLKVPETKGRRLEEIQQML